MLTQPLLLARSIPPPDAGAFKNLTLADMGIDTAVLLDTDRTAYQTGEPSFLHHPAGSISRD
jgi:hypothetical protein